MFSGNTTKSFFSMFSGKLTLKKSAAFSKSVFCNFLPELNQ